MLTCRSYSSRNLLNFYVLQVGTVLNVEDAKNATNAGAKFVMSPATVKVFLQNLKFSMFKLKVLDQDFVLSPFSLD